MDLQGKQLDIWFLEENFGNDRFPYHNKDDYKKKYQNITEALIKKILPYVNTSLMINDDGVLTDHGPDHIRMLIDRISSFLDNSEYVNLSPYETYILLIAAHIHDVGNIYGRLGHETKARKVVEDLKSLNLDRLDQFELDSIAEIAESHGGSISSDPIGNLSNEMTIADVPKKGEKHVRGQLLAAILRFADELSENRSRATRYNLIKDTLPKKSKIFHIYADSIISIDPDLRDHTIKMHYKIMEEYLQKIPKMIYEKDENGEIKKDSGGKNIEKFIETYLLDEIYLRTLKTHYERLYCGRYLRNLIYFNSIEVDIQIVRINVIIKKYSYTLLGGSECNDNYTIDDFYSLCPNMKNNSGEAILEKLNN